MAGDIGLGQTMAMVLAPLPPFKFGQAKAEIRVINTGVVGQAKGHVVKFAKQNGLGQAQGQVV